MKRTSLYDTHRALGATMVPFAGWEMPVSYKSGTVAEVAAVRERAGLFDVSHMGEARVSGPCAYDFVQWVTTNDVSKLDHNRAQYSLLLDDTGGVIDDILVYLQGWQDILVVLNAGCKDKDWEWLRRQSENFPVHQHDCDGDFDLRDESDQTALLAVQGPRGVETVERCLARDALETALTSVASLKRFRFGWSRIAGALCTISRTGYTGEDGVEIFCAWDDAPAVWAALADAGATPCGLAARDVLRLEAAYPLYGHELDSEHGPLESGVGWAVKTKKGEFIGRHAVLAARDAGLQHQLVGLKMDERAIPRENYPVLSSEDKEPLGTITSGTYSPTVKAGIALARLRSEAASPGTRVTVDIRGRQAGATIVSLPFYRNGV